MQRHAGTDQGYLIVRSSPVEFGPPTNAICDGPPSAISRAGEEHRERGGESDSGTRELDVRAIPHAIRHATVLGAFDAIPSGGSMVLVASHDPQPLLRQLAQRAGGTSRSATSNADPGRGG